MEGADQGGYAGFHDQVSTHFWSKSAAPCCSASPARRYQPLPAAGVNGQNYNSQQIAAAALGQQFAQLRRGICPRRPVRADTLEIRPGYRFVVMVNKEMHLRPYVDQRTAGAASP